MSIAHSKFTCVYHKNASFSSFFYRSEHLNSIFLEQENCDECLAGSGSKLNYRIFFGRLIQQFNLKVRVLLGIL